MKGTGLTFARRYGPFTARLVARLDAYGCIDTIVILVVAYPDENTFKALISRLQIGWMMTQSRGTLDIQRSFLARD